MQIMQGTQSPGQVLLRLQQVVNVSARIILRDIAAYCGVNRRKIPLKPRTHKIQPTVQRVHATAAAQASRRDAIERVRAGLDRREQVIRLRNAEQVAGLILRELLGNPADDRAEVLLLQRAADAEAAETTVALRLRLRGQLHQPAGRLSAEILVLRALHHAPQRLRRAVRAQVREPLVLRQATASPTVRARDGLLLVGAGIHQRGELVEREHNVRAQLVLDLHRHLRREAVLAAVDDATEIHAVLVHHGHTLFLLLDDVRLAAAFCVHGQDFLVAHAEAHDLEATGVRVRRPVPVLELCEPAGLVHDVRAWLKVQVVRVGKHRLRARRPHLLGREGLDRCFCPHRDERWGVDVPMRSLYDARTPQPARASVRSRASARTRACLRTCACAVAIAQPGTHFEG